MEVLINTLENIWDREESRLVYQEGMCAEIQHH